MKRQLVSILPAFLAALTWAMAALGEQSLPQTASAQVSTKILESKFSEVEAATDIAEDTKTKLLGLYREALSNLQTAKKDEDAAQSFRQASQTAPAQTHKLRHELGGTHAASARSEPDVAASASLSEIDRMLQKEKSDLAAESAQRADIEKRLDTERERPPELIQQRLTEARKQLDEITGQLRLPLPDAEDGAAVAQARLWLLQSRHQVLDAQVAMLDQELRSRPVRLDLLEAQRDQAVAAEEQASARVSALEDLVIHKRQEDADQAKANAEETQRQAEDKNPLVADLAKRNADLSSRIAAMSSRLDERARQTKEADKLADQIRNDYQSARETIAIGGLSQELGHMLLQQRQSLPDLRSLRRKSEEREREAAKIGVQRLRFRQEQKQLRDLNSWVDDMLARAPADTPPEVRKELLELAAERRTLLEKAVESSDFQLRRLSALETAQRSLLEAIQTYDAFLSENLLWVRSASRAQLEELGALPEQVWRILSPAGWLEVARVLTYEATHSPVLVVLVLVLGALLWSRRRLIAAVRATSANLGKPTTDHFRFSLQALGLTLVAASAWPLTTAVIGWQLKASPEATDFSSAVGVSLLAIAAQLYFLRVFHLICIPEGLAAAHFRWREANLALVRTEVNRLSWIYLPAALVSIIALRLDPLNLGWMVGRSAFVILVASLAFAFYRLLHPTSGALADYLRRPDRQTFRRLHRIWYPLLVAAPLVLGVLSLMGYVYTAGTLLGLLVRTTWMILGLTLVEALARRWLLVTRRHLAYEAAIERRQKALQVKEAADQGKAPDVEVATEVEEEPADLVALTETSSKLIDTAVVVAGLVGLWMIWSGVLPALRVLEDITLWQHTVTIKGHDEVQPFTLADLGLVLLYTAGTILLAKQLPSVLEIILLKRVGLSSGARYTITTLTTYAVVALGILLVLSTVGAQWSKLQWLVAALGVGVGFGLQEIVANFISGIIILAERPVRVGDIVSVGGTDGVVTKIRIRATSIRNWDRQELLVPNKELVTGQVLNWSLTDRTTRVVVTVGVAYGTDVDKALDLMREAAEEQEHVLADPAPLLSFEGFGDNSLTLVLRVYLDSIDYKLSTTTELHKVINRKLEAARIVISFPQRDLHLDTAEALRVKIEEGSRGDTEGRG